MATKGKLSRADIETACMLLAIGEGSATAQVVVRLGLSPAIGRAVENALNQLAGSGLVTAENERWSLSNAGRAKLRDYGIPG